MKLMTKILTISLALFLGAGVAYAAIPRTSKVSSNDSTAGYLNGKLQAGANITLTEGSDGGDETLTIAAAGGGTGSAITFDIGDDGGNDSTDLSEIATSGDTNNIFTEPSDDKMLIDLTQNYPQADTAVALAANGANCTSGNAPLGVDASGAVESCFDVWTEAENTAASYISATLTEEEVEDYVGGMLGGTETHISVDYQDTTNDIDFVVDASGVAGGISEGDLADSSVVSADIKDGEVSEADLKIVDVAVDEDIFTYESTTGDFEWHTSAELGIGTATAITDGLIVEPDLDADNSPSDADILTYDSTGTNFAWITPNAGTDITADLEEEVTEGSLADDTIVSADIKDDTIDSADYAAGSIDEEHLNIANAAVDEYVLTYEADTTNFEWVALAGGGDVTDVFNCTTGDCNQLTMGESEYLIGGAVDGTTDPYISLPQGTDCSTVSGEGRVCWDTDNNALYVGDGASALAVGGSEVNNLETDGAADIADTEIFIGTGVDTGNYAAVSGDASLANTGALTIAADAVEEGMLKAVDAAADEDILTYETTTGDFEWHTAAEMGIGTATAITDGLIIEPDLNADNAASDADILTYDSTGTNFAWITPNAGTDVTADLEEESHASEHDGRSTTANGEAIDVDAEIYTDSKCLYFEDPTAADDFLSFWTAPTAVTITGLNCESDQTVNYDVQIDDGTPADVNGSDIACTSTWAEDTTLAGDTSVGVNEHLDLAIESVSGTPTWVSICVEFTKDD